MSLIPASDKARVEKMDDGPAPMITT
jgi:hypothetical protein